MENTGEQLIASWNLLYHLPQDTDRSAASYKYIMENIDTIDKVITISKSIPENIVKFCMLSVMKVGIIPSWEDVKNRNGGSFSYKVINKFVPVVWNELMYSLCGHTLTKEKQHMELVNGVTISPKKNFCIIKIWLYDCSLQDTDCFITINNLGNSGVFFKKHVPEY